MQRFGRVAAICVICGYLFSAGLPVFATGLLIPGMSACALGHRDNVTAWSCA
jgi:hypothetical protein